MSVDVTGCARLSDGPRTKLGAVAKALAVAFLFAASAAAAEAGGEVFLKATYLAAPTDWCPETEGVPLVVVMDGPDIIEGPKAWPRTVRVNKGGDVSQFVTGNHIASFKRPEDFEGPSATVIGRFSAEFRTCHSAWGRSRPNGSWRVTGKDGATLGSGVYASYFFSSLDPPFFRPVGGASNAQFAKFDDQTFFAIGPIEMKVSQTFLGKPDKE